MRLNTATVESWVLNGKDYASSKKKFFKALCKTHDFKVKLVFGNKVLDRGSVTFMENSGWIIAHVDSKFMFDSDVTVSGLTISISNKENEIVNSQTDIEYIFGKNKCIDADLYFAVGTIYPYNQLKQDVPESLFRVSEYDCSNKLNFDSLPDAAGEDDFEDWVMKSSTFTDVNGTELYYKVGFTDINEELSEALDLTVEGIKENLNLMTMYYDSEYTDKCQTTFRTNEEFLSSVANGTSTEYPSSGSAILQVYSYIDGEYYEFATLHYKAFDAATDEPYADDSITIPAEPGYYDGTMSPIE